MPRNRFGVANSFTNSFMRGFSFVDDINRRRKSDARLEEELQRQRARQERQDAIAAEDRAFSLGERDRQVQRRAEMEEAAQIMADPNFDPAELSHLTHIPEISSAVNSVVTRRQEGEDIQTIMGPSGLEVVPADTQPLSSPVAQSPGGLSAQVQEAAPPNTNAPTEFMTQDDIQALSLSDPQAATQIRDAQNADEAERQANRAASRSGLAVGGRFAGFGAGAPVEPTEFDKAERKKAANRDATTSQWAAFADINDQSGDQLRQVTPTQLVGAYWQDRNSIDDPQVQMQADARIRPQVAEAITSQQEILTNPEMDPNGLEARNARRKLGQAMGLAKDIGLEFKPLMAAGVDRRGLPIDGRNPQLTDAAIQAAQNAPYSPVPSPTSQQRADVTMVNRGTKGRVSERFAQAATRLYQNSRITTPQLESLLRTGRLPSAAPQIKEWDPKKNLYMTGPNGVFKIVAWGTDQDSDGDGRNLLSDDGWKNVNEMALAYTGGDKEQAGYMALAFKNFVSRHENRLTSRNYRFDNVNDTTDAFMRYAQSAGVADAFNNELFVGFDFNPDFSEHHGSVDEAFFKNLEGIVQDENLRVPGSTTFGLGGDEPEVPNQIRSHSPESLQQVRALPNLPVEVQQMNDAQLSAWISQNFPDL